MYSLTSSTGKSLVLDAGINPRLLFKKIMPSSIEGVLVTHSHGDHSRYVSQFQKRFVKVFAPYEDKGIEKLEDYREIIIGEYRIIPMKMNHDVPCFGYLITHSELRYPVLYATDTNGIPYIFENLSLCIVEADYDTSILKHNYEVGNIELFRANRISKTHNSIEQAAMFVRDNVASAERVLLTHLSAMNADKEHFQSVFKDMTGIDAMVAEDGVEIDLDYDNVFK